MHTVELCMCAPCALQLLLFGKFHQFYLLFLFSGFLVSVYTFLQKAIHGYSFSKPSPPVEPMAPGT